MASFIPGCVILYHEPRSGLPLWPSIYCTNDVAPEAFLRTRPPGYDTLILKLTGAPDASQLRWATTTDLNYFDPFAADEGTKQSSPGLADAYSVALEALDSGLDLDYWKAVLGGQDHDTISIDSDDNEVDSDKDMRLAIEKSIVDFHSQQTLIKPKPAAFQAKRLEASQWSSIQPSGQSGLFPSRIPDRKQTLPLRKHAQNPSRYLTSTPSPPRRAPFALSPRLSKRPISPYLEPSDDELHSPPRRRKLSAGGRSSMRSYSYSFSSQPSNCTPSPALGSDDDDLPPPPRQNKSSTASKLKSFGGVPEISGTHRESSMATQGLSVSGMYSHNGLNTSATQLPKKDIIEEKLEESNQFVQVFVGPKVENDPEADSERKQHRFQLLKRDVWDRPYFRNPLAAHNYLTPMGENTWELQHPRLLDILPDDFIIVAEFLSDGEFGNKQPNDEEQVAETFAQCISAWRSAELLSMDDLLDHIVKKIRLTQPWWDMVNIMAFACSVYQSDISLQAHDEMKALLSDYIADFFYVYIRDDHLSGHFTTRLQQLPELERDVFAKKAAQSNKRLSQREGEAALSEGEVEDGIDL